MRQTKKVIEEELLVSEKLHKKWVLENTLSKLLLKTFIEFTNRIHALFISYFIDENEKERENE